MSLKKGQYVFGIVDDVRDYGFMIDTTEGRGLLHKSRVHLMLGNPSPMDRELLVLRCDSDEDSRGFKFSFDEKRKVDYHRVISEQFGTSQAHAILKERLSDDSYLLEIRTWGETLLIPPFPCTLVKTAFYKNRQEAFDQLVPGEQFDVEVTGYDIWTRRLTCSARFPWEKTDSDVTLQGEITAVHLNAVEITVEPHGKLMIPLESIPNYQPGYEPRFPLHQQVKVQVKQLKSHLSIQVLGELLPPVEEAETTASTPDPEQPDKTHVLFLGGTGSGKSSLINAILAFYGNDSKKAEIGLIDPTTVTMEQYPCNDFVLWDSPGVGDGEEQDMAYGRMITEWLHSHKNDKVVIVPVFDANARDYGATFQLLNIIRPLCRKNVLFCVNKADTPFPPGTFFDAVNYGHDPGQRMRKKLLDKKTSVQRRVQEETKIEGAAEIVAARIIGDKTGISFRIRPLMELVKKLTQD